MQNKITKNTPKCVRSSTKLTTMKDHLTVHMKEAMIINH